MRSRCMAYATRALFPEILMGFYTDSEIVDAMDVKINTKVNEEGDIEIVQDAEVVDEENNDID